MGNRLYVGNLSFHTNEDSLRDAFAQYGEVVEAKIVTDRETGRSRGFGFVTMADGDGARNAIAQLNGAMMDGRDLRVNEAEDRPQRGGFGGLALAVDQRHRRAGGGQCACRGQADAAAGSDPLDPGVAAAAGVGRSPAAGALTVCGASVQTPQKARTGIDRPWARALAVTRS